VWDGFLGVRYVGDINERWIWSVRADAGTGDTDFTWHGVVTFGLNLGKELDKTLFFGYRHLSYEFDAGSSGITDRDLEYSGAMTGFRFTF
jgi:hypothetical protein